MAIRDAGALAGVVLNPATPVNSVEEALQFTDYVLVMSVNPGFGGQKFIPQAIDKVKRLRRMIDERQLNVRIEIDGGIDRKNIETVVAAGADRSWISRFWNTRRRSGSQRAPRRYGSMGLKSGSRQTGQLKIESDSGKSLNSHKDKFYWRLIL
jgi:hypothetical protein